MTVSRLTVVYAAVVFDLTVQLQTDPRRMPVENNGVRWPERLSPRIPVARLRLPAQRFDSSAQLAFADNLSYNSWHCVSSHRPLGNQNRARRVIYVQLSKLRQEMNGEPHSEPTGDEVFEPVEVGVACEVSRRDRLGGRVHEYAWRPDHGR
jgi:hypothetical protein